MLDARQLPADDTHALHGQTHHATRGEVGAQVLQNFAGGCGVAIAIAALQSLAGVSVVEHWEYPAYLGALAWGVAMFVRSQIDEYKGWLNIHAIKAVHRREMELVTARSDEFEQERDQARADLQIARSEANRLTNELYTLNAQMQRERHEANRRTGGPVVWWADTDRRDAHALMKLWYETKSWPGESTMGWSRERQRTARDLLQSAQIAPAKIYSSLAPPEDFAWAEARLNAYFANKNVA
jgi:hypothetical protein